jgi:hypothetical protein
MMVTEDRQKPLLTSLAGEEGWGKDSSEFRVKGLQTSPPHLSPLPDGERRIIFKAVRVQRGRQFQS